jgi:hypothetical protein
MPPLLKRTARGKGKLYIQNPHDGSRNAQLSRQIRLYRAWVGREAQNRGISLCELPGQQQYPDLAVSVALRGHVLMMHTDPEGDNLAVWRRMGSRWCVKTKRANKGVYRPLLYALV